jgi:hypothetical protein
MVHSDYRMVDVCEKYTLDQLVGLSSKDMDRLLAHYREGTVPSYESIRGDEPIYQFDGSFGWHC